jgi:hypothetical protein
MDVPPEIQSLVRQHLGKQAIETQRRGGRGVWIITPDDQASYILAAHLDQVIGAGDGGDLAELRRMINTFDPERQVVFIFNFSDDLQFVGTVDAV